MRVTIDRRTLNNFRRRAKRAFPLEHIEALFGHASHDSFQIHLFHPMDYRGTPMACYYSDYELEILRESAESLHLDLLGTIHTHIGIKQCAHPSPHDYKTAKREGEALMGVCNVYKVNGIFYTQINFFRPQDHITIEYSLCSK